MNLITKYFKLDSLPTEIKSDVEEIAKKNEIDPNSVSYMRKGLETFKQADFTEGERAIITYISTGSVDRDGDIVKPDGVDVTSYMKHPVVLFSHKYSDGLPLGRSAWIKNDKDSHGLIAKTIYANTPQADLVWNYRKEGFPLAVSVGFLPTKMVSRFDSSKKEEFDLELKNAIIKGWVKPNETDKVKNIIQKWTLLEYSDCAIPCNSEALQIAIAKGLVSKDEVEEVVVQKEVEEKKDVSIKEVSTTPPSTITGIEVKDEVAAEEKKLDSKGNPSIYDIMNAIHKKMPEMSTMFSEINKYTENNNESMCCIEDLYPLNYPSGHCILYFTVYGGVAKYYDCKYTFNADAQEVAMGTPKEVTVGYSSKYYVAEREVAVKFDKAHNDARKKEFDEKIKSNKVEIKELEELPALNVTYSKDWVSESDRYIGIIEVNDTFYKTQVEKGFIDCFYKQRDKIQKAKEEFSKLVATEGKTKDDWEELFNKFTSFVVDSFIGKDQIVEFCKENGLLHKEYMKPVEVVKVEDEDELILKGIEETENEISIRIKDPSKFQDDTFRRKTVKSSKPKVVGIFAKLTGDTTMTLQALRFPKADGWTKESAKAWYKEHKNSFKTFMYDSISLDEVVDLISLAVQENNKAVFSATEEKLGKIFGRVQINE